jgi:hypothetical protein
VENKKAYPLGAIKTGGVTVDNQEDTLVCIIPKGHAQNKRKMGV